MPSPNLVVNLCQPFLDAGGLLADALLYLDAGAAEVIQSVLGLGGLQGAPGFLLNRPERRVALELTAGKAYGLSLRRPCSSADLKVPHAFDLDDSGPRDAEVYRVLTGREPDKVVIVTTQLLTITHNSVLRAVQVTLAPG